MTSTDKGDYVLPGDASTYPNGGLHARYSNNLDLQSNANALSLIHAPSRMQSYGATTTQEYADQQDPQINGQANPTPGAATSWWSCIWFGAIYLKLSAGNYPFDVYTGGQPSSDVAFRLWIGNLQFGQQILDAWNFTSAGGNNNVTLTASSLAGSLPYGAGTIERDGWYPIKLEYAVAGTAATAPVLYFTPPAAYTDPGGTALAASTQVIVPSTSLSPLGCVDQRYQGIAHFDLAQQTALAAGYQIALEPKQLESGAFPGVLAPRIREGHDTDIVLAPDRSIRDDGEGILNYSSTSDAADFASSLWGNGAGFQSGTTGQLQASVFDPATMLASLFDAQQWQDQTDASFASLLQALLNSQLSLQLTPWQLLSADPYGRPRNAFTWPLPGSIAQMRWRAGDGLRIDAPDINVVDTAPRQMLVITPSFTPLGLTGKTATFANRPRNAAHTLKQQLYAATRQQRNYQRQLVLVTGTTQANVVIPAATLDSGASWAAVSPSDQIVSARLVVTGNSAGVAFDVYINGSNVTTTLGGPWTTIPLTLDVTAVAAMSSSSQFYAQLENAGAVSSTFSYALVVEVLR